MRLRLMSMAEPDDEVAAHHDAVAHHKSVTVRDYESALLRLFADVDPWELILIGAPRDEYSPEVHDLMRYSRAISADDVLETFRRFALVKGRDGKLLDPQPAPIMPVSRADAQRLADGVARLRREYERSDRS